MLYGQITEQDYLLGKFKPSQHKLFVSVRSVGVPGSRRQLMRREAAEALAKLYKALRKDLPRSRFRIISATRSYDVQHYLWAKRWAAKSKLRYRARARAVLRFTAMPGTSRHHWGTDFDLTRLSNRYYRWGRGARLYKWLKANAARFGYCQPYTAGRKKGYLEERWHWSYKPLARRFQKAWLKHFGSNSAAFVRLARFRGNRTVRRWLTTYVSSVDKSCL